MDKVDTITGNKLIAEFMGFPKVTGMSKWDYDRSLDNATVTAGLVVNDINEHGVKFQQKMPYERYGLSYFDGTVFTPNDKSLQKYTPSKPYHSDWNLLMGVVQKIEELEYNVEISGRWCTITGNFQIKEIRGVDKIEAVWQAVTQFIIWFNQNSK